MEELQSIGDLQLCSDEHSETTFDAYEMLSRLVESDFETVEFIALGAYASVDCDCDCDCPFGGVVMVMGVDTWNVFPCIV